jgi:hypothetical protein
MVNYSVSNLSASPYRLIFRSIFQTARDMGSGRRNSQQFTGWLKACLSKFDSTGGGQGLSVKENGDGVVWRSLSMILEGEMRGLAELLHAGV